MSIKDFADNSECDPQFKHCFSNLEQFVESYHYKTVNQVKTAINLLCYTNSRYETDNND
jgi:hypothetical protein